MSDRDDAPERAAALRGTGLPLAAARLFDGLPGQPLLQKVPGHGCFKQPSAEFTHAGSSQFLCHASQRPIHFFTVGVNRVRL